MLYDHRVFALVSIYCFTIRTMRKINRYDIDAVKVIGTDNAYSGFTRLDIITLSHKKFSGGWSNILTREVLKKQQVVAVLLYDPKRDTLVFTEQFRVGALDDPSSPWQIEVLAGLVEDENIVDTVYREVKEEAHAKILALEKALSYWVSPGTSNEYLYLYVAAIDSNKLPEITGVESEDEDIRLIKYQVAQAMQLVHSGELNNSATIIALNWFALHHTRIQQQWRSLL